MSLHEDILALGQRAAQAARRLAVLTSAERRRILLAMAEAVDAARGDLAAANARDMADGREAGLSAALLDRLELTEARVDGMIAGLRHVAALPDPLGAVIGRFQHPKGMEVQKRRVPIGVIGIIYESRPNVTADAAALCLAAGNAVILRGGREALRSNQAIAAALLTGGAAAGLPEGALQIVDTTDRAAVRELCRLEGLVDLIIPRGGEGLIRAVSEMALVPVLKHAKGVCHTYVDASADLAMALAICENAKCQRPGVCNAMETLLVHEAAAADFLPAFARRAEDRGLELRGDARARALLPGIKAATAEDWPAEYLDLILAVAVVPDVEAAIEHIARHGSGHSDAIVARDEAAQAAFLAGVDSAAVYVNASTRFTDGGQFGMGAEIGISTDRLHARGPMGLEELTTYKYVILGDGQIRD